MFVRFGVIYTISGYTGIKTTTVCPYFINTGMFSGTNFLALGYQEPDDVASAVVKAVLLNQELVILQGLLQLGLMLKSYVIPLTRIV